MRRRTVLAALGAAASALSGCNAGGDRAVGIDEPATPVPVPTDRSTPEADPPADLSELGVESAAELGERHWRTLSTAPHGFSREATVSEDGEWMRRMRVTVRARADAAAYHFRFEADDTERYPSRPAHPYLELWDDGTTYQRFGRREPAYAVTDGPAFDAPSTRTAERYRVRRLFEAFSSVEVDPAAGDFEAAGTDLRLGYDVTPRRFRLVANPWRARLEAIVNEESLFVKGYDLSVRAEVANRPVDVDASVDYERLEDPPEPPSWVETAREERA